MDILAFTKLAVWLISFSLTVLIIVSFNDIPKAKKSIKDYLILFCSLVFIWAVIISISSQDFRIRNKASNIARTPIKEVKMNHSVYSPSNIITNKQKVLNEDIYINNLKSNNDTKERFLSL